MHTSKEMVCIPPHPARAVRKIGTLFRKGICSSCSMDNLRCKKMGKLYYIFLLSVHFNSRFYLLQKRET